MTDATLSLDSSLLCIIVNHIIVVTIIFVAVHTIFTI